MEPVREIPSEQEARLLLKVTELQRQLESIGKENASLRFQRDIARADLKMFIPLATPEEEAEALRLQKVAIPNGLAQLIAALESEGVASGRHPS